MRTAFNSIYLALAALPLLCACSPSDGSSPNPALDPDTELSRLEQQVNQTAVLPSLNDSKDAADHSASYRIGTVWCRYEDEHSYSITAVSDATFDETTDSTAAPLAGNDPSCPGTPPNFVAHQAGTYNKSDYVQGKLAALHRLFDVKTRLANSPQVSQITLTLSQDEVYPVGGQEMKVRHFAFDVALKNGHTDHENYYFSLESWFLGDVARVIGYDSRKPFVTYEVTRFQGAR